MRAKIQNVGMDVANVAKIQNAWNRGAITMQGGVKLFGRKK